MKRRLPSINALTNCCALFFIVITVVASRPHTANQQSCAVEITSPTTGAKVHRDALVTGTARIPSNGHLWVLAHKRGLDDWWLQGRKERPVSNGPWEVRAFFGAPYETGQFEVAAVVVDEHTNTMLQALVETAREHNEDPITSFPTPLDGCAVVKIMVEREGN